MPLELFKERWVSKVNQVTIGATQEQGGTRSKSIKVGGEATLPFLYFEGDLPNPPIIALEVLDMVPENYPPQLVEPFEDVIEDPVAWAKKCASQYGADLICLNLISADPENKDTSPEECAQLVKKVLQAVQVPLIIRGPGEPDKDNEVMPRCSEIAKGENCLLGLATDKNYKTIVVSCMADNHSVIAQSPIDINIAKQLNILISDMGFPLERIIIDPTTGGLGYGIEYTYSIMERLRLATLQGDKTVAMPMINFVGQEAWKAKEAKTPTSEQPDWGDETERGILWEAITATTLIQAGADILVMRHPQAAQMVKEYISELTRVVKND